MTTSNLAAKLRGASRTNFIVAAVIGVAVLIAGYTILFTNALSAFTTAEPESANLVGATVGTDATASGGKYLQFGSAQPTDPGTPPASGAYITDYYKKWSNGPNPTGDPAYFPISVWLQDASRTRNGIPNGTNYQKIGVNLGVGIWDDEWYSLRYQGVIDTKWQAFPGVNRASEIKKLTGATATYFNGYMLDDEADMNYPNDPAQYSTVNEKKMADAARATDPTRPVYSNYGKCLAIYEWVGCHKQAGYDTDMKAYCDLVDLVSADYYGWTDPWEPASYHGAWTYGASVDNMRKYCGQNKPIWGFVEAANPWSPGQGSITPKAITADQMEQAVWSMVVHGANGIVYFAHDFSNGLVEDAMLSRPEIVARATTVNARLKSLAPILNSYSQGGVSATGTNGIPVATMYKKYNGGNYVFAMADGNANNTASGATTGTITVPVASGSATVVGENRTVPISGGKIIDAFTAYQMHEYQF